MQRWEVFKWVHDWWPLKNVSAPLESLKTNWPQENNTEIAKTNSAGHRGNRVFAEGECDELLGHAAHVSTGGRAIASLSARKTNMFG
jgi:hypothetical protein